MIDEKKLINNVSNYFMNRLAELSLFKITRKRVEQIVKTSKDIIDIIEQQPKTDWIPFELREADEEEKEYWIETYGYEIEYMLCGRLPDEDEEIIVSYANGCVGEDIFMRDGCDCYLDSGNELVTEAIAWMPKPQPYKKEGADDE